jgi:hypothetical protein
MKKLLLGMVIAFVIPISSASATTWCNGKALFQTPFGYYALNNYQCVQSYGNGNELGYWYITRPYGRTEGGNIAGCFFVQLTDNNQAIANSWEACNPTLPSYTLWAGSVYHPYWGNYCSTLYVLVGGYHQTPYWVPEEQFQPSAYRRCVYINGYQ